MSDDLNLDRIDQEIRINELREAANEAAGGDMISWEDSDAPPEVAEQFWENVLAYEQAEHTCHFFSQFQAAKTANASGDARRLTATHANHGKDIEISHFHVACAVPGSAGGVALRRATPTGVVTDPLAEPGAETATTKR